MKRLFFIAFFLLSVSAMAGNKTDLFKEIYIDTNGDGSYSTINETFTAASHAAVTLASPNRYLSLSGQQITPGVVAVADGGTGLSAAGAANQMMGTNAAANGLEYKNFFVTGSTAQLGADDSTNDVLTLGAGSITYNETSDRIDTSKPMYVNGLLTIDASAIAGTARATIISQAGAGAQAAVFTLRPGNANPVDMGAAGTNGHFFTSALAGDAIIRASTGKGIRFGVEGADVALSILSTSHVVGTPMPMSAGLNASTVLTDTIFFKMADGVQMSATRGRVMARAGSIVRVSGSFDLTAASGGASTYGWFVCKAGTGSVWSAGLDTTIGDGKTFYAEKNPRTYTFVAGDVISWGFGESASGSYTVNEAEMTVEVVYH
jgi:hypothetical protein